MKNKKEKKEFDITVHYSIKDRKRFKRQMWLRFIIMILILCGCSVMVMFGGWTWDPDKGFSPTTDPKEGYQYALIWLGAIIALAAIAAFTVTSIFTFKKFYDSQEKYFKTKEFKEKKEKARSQDPGKLDKSTIKWYKKLGYITGSEKADWMSKMKDAKMSKKREPKNKSK